MFRAIAALAMASATAAHSPAMLNPTAPWWEKVTVTVTDDGQTHSCLYETSMRPEATQDCSVVGSAKSMTKASSPGSAEQFTRITFERRFTPAAKPSLAVLEPGETLLGGQVMALAIDGHGAVKDCKVVASSGAVTPQYGCDDASAERFSASAATGHARTAEREGYMTIVVYGHSEHVV